MSNVEARNAAAAFSDAEVGEGFAAYRALSKGAVLATILGLASLLPLALWMTGTVAPVLLVLPFGGLISGLIGLRHLRMYPNELSGKPLAWFGLVVSAILFVVGSTVQSYVYATEVPEGYQRIAFETLKAGSRQPDAPPEEAIALDGEQVFIKGYIYPGQQRYGLKQFVLVPDLGTCCFGGSPKLTHMIEVTLKGDQTVDYSMTKRKLAGTLRVNPSLQPVDGRPGVDYQLFAETAQ